MTKEPFYHFPEEVPTKRFYEEITGVFAGRGGGKTTLIKKIIDKKRPPQVVWIDPTLEKVHTLDEAWAQMVAGKRFVRVSASGIEAGFMLLYCYMLSSKEQPVFAVCDEAATYLGKTHDFLKTCFNLGRHAGFGMILASQRPTGIHPDFRNQAAVSFFGRLAPADIQNAAAPVIGRELAATLATAATGYFINSETGKPANINAPPSANKNAAPSPEKETK